MERIVVFGRGNYKFPFIVKRRCNLRLDKDSTPSRGNGEDYGFLGGGITNSFGRKVVCKLHLVKRLFGNQSNIDQPTPSGGQDKEKK